MRLGSVVVGVSVLALFFGCGQNSTQQKPAESSSSGVVSSENDTENEFQSARYGFRWRLPPDWKFISAERITQAPIHPGADVVAAQTKGDENPRVLIVMVKDVFSYPGEEPTLGPENVEKYASTWMRAAGIQKEGSAPLELLGADAFRFDGSLDARGKKIHVALVIFHRSRRHFELQCFSARHQAGTPCGSALTGFVIDEMADSP